MTLELSGKMAFITGVFAMFEPQDWITLVTGAGLGTSIAVVLLHQLLKERNIANSQIKEDRDEDRKRITALEKFQQETLLNLIQQATIRQQSTEEALREGTAVIKENTRVGQECIHVLSTFERHR